MPDCSYRIFKKFSSIQQEFATDCLISPRNDLSVEKHVRAIWDTGTTDTVINESLARELQLLPIDEGEAPYQAVGQEIKAGTNYQVTMRFPDMKSIDTSVEILASPWEIGLLSVDVDNVGHDEVLLGMDVISRGTLIISGGNTFCFLYPVVSWDQESFVRLFS